MFQKWARRILLGFVLITIGFSWGRQTAPSSTREDATPEVVSVAGNQLVVYAAHMTFRCFECTQIELWARELLKTEFPDYLDDERIRIVTVDYMKDEPFATQYNIASSTLVLAQIENGVETTYDRLDDVWTHIRNREAYMEYVRNAVWTHLHALEGPKE